jgi:Protein of unknown function (DUF642)
MSSFPSALRQVEETYMRPTAHFALALAIAATACLAGCSGTAAYPAPNGSAYQGGTTPLSMGPNDTCPLGTGWPVLGNLTPDGDFDSVPMPPTSQGHVFYGAGGFINPTLWFVGGAGIDFVNTTYWLSPPPNGNNVCKVDLDATPGAGSISETFNTSPGHVYHVKFWFSGSSEPPQGPVNKMQVSAAGQSRMFHWNTAGGNDVGHDIWKLKHWKFRATGCPSTLTFASLDPGDWSSGPVVTEIVVLGKQVDSCSPR